MSYNLKNQVAVVTGAAQGLGKGTAIRLAREGVQVVAADVNPEVKSIEHELPASAAGTRGYAVVADVTSEEQVEALIDGAIRRFGRLDIMFNNAGVAQSMTDVTDTQIDQYERVVSVNLRGVFLGSRAAARYMREQGRGRIINTASTYGKRGYAKFAVYCASEAGVIAFTQSLAFELASSGVTANSICPGNMATQMHWESLRREASIRSISLDEIAKEVRGRIPLQRHGTADDVAGTVCWLASDDASYVTGCSINVAGGSEVH